MNNSLNEKLFNWRILLKYLSWAIILKNQSSLFIHILNMGCSQQTPESPTQSSQSQRCLGSPYWAWAGWAGKQIWMLLIQNWILRQIFKKAKQQICTSNSQICFPAQTAQAQYRLPRQRWLWELWLPMSFEWKIYDFLSFGNKKLAKCRALKVLGVSAAWAVYTRLGPFGQGSRSASY